MSFLPLSTWDLLPRRTKASDPVHPLPRGPPAPSDMLAPLPSPLPSWPSLGWPREPELADLPSPGQGLPSAAPAAPPSTAAPQAHALWRGSLSPYHLSATRVRVPPPGQSRGLPLVSHSPSGTTAGRATCLPHAEPAFPAGRGGPRTTLYLATLSQLIPASGPLHCFLSPHHFSFPEPQQGSDRRTGSGSGCPCESQLTRGLWVAVDDVLSQASVPPGAGSGVSAPPRPPPKLCMG